MQWSPLILHQEVVEDEVDDVDERAVALDAPQKPDYPVHPRRWHRRGRGFGGPALPILRVRGGLERRSLGTTQQREKMSHMTEGEFSFLYARKMEDNTKNH